MDEEVPENVDAVTVFSANNSDIAKNRVTQCQEHKWRKLNEKELACLLCPTVVIVSPESMLEMYGK